LIKSKYHALDVAFSPDGRTVAVGLGNKRARLYDVATGRQVAVLEGHSEAVTSVAFSPDGNLVVSGSTDKTVRIWEVKSGKLLATLRGHTDPVFEVAFSPDGTRIASGGNDMTFALVGRLKRVALLEAALEERRPAPIRR